MTEQTDNKELPQADVVDELQLVQFLIHLRDVAAAIMLTLPEHASDNESMASCLINESALGCDRAEVFRDSDGGKGYRVYVTGIEGRVAAVRQWVSDQLADNGLADVGVAID